MKSAAPILCAFLASFLMFCGGPLKAQNCGVDADSLKGTYEGECKKGSAHGKGKAVGAHTYDGEFKNGLPSGQGTYNWPGGNVYTGAFVKGMKEGKGFMTTKRPGNTDSTTEGYWKKDKYVGLYETPWRLVSRTGSITTVDVVHTKQTNVNKVTITVINTTGGTKTMTGGEMRRYTVDNINILKGAYMDVQKFDAKTKGTQTMLTMVTYPLQVVLTMGREEVNLEFNEGGSYSITIHINE